MSNFPISRGRRLRGTHVLRSLVRETTVTANDLVYPMFVHSKATSPISSMPGISRFSPADLLVEVESLLKLGLTSVILFGIPDFKDSVGSSGYDADGVVPNAIRNLKLRFGSDLLLIADVCMCEYTDHGHCGVLVGEQVINDPSLELLTKCAVVYAGAGADIIAPSDMMDGRVRAIRYALDKGGFHECPIMAYSAKYASGFYGPFREAADSTPQIGDRKGYQMDPGNRLEAIKEVLQDIGEGADMVMVKPALPYLDVIREIRNIVNVPVAAYNVSGEYSMVKAAAANGWIDEDRVISESMTSIKRAGADIILTYHAKEFLQKGLG